MKDESSFNVVIQRNLSFKMKNVLCGQIESLTTELLTSTVVITKNILRLWCSVVFYVLKHFPVIVVYDCGSLCLTCIYIAISSLQTIKNASPIHTHKTSKAPHDISMLSQ